MTKATCSSFLAAFVGAITMLSATPASAQYLDLTPTVVGVLPANANQGAEATPRPPLFKPFTDALGDFRHLPTRSNAQWLVAGLAVAATAHAADREVTEDFAGTGKRTFRSGAVIGGTPFELGASFAAYAIGRSFNKPGVMSLGADLVRAQIVAEALTVGIKQGTRRSRPEGGGFSFPSGHTSAAFASATVIQQHYGWKFGAPAYAVATFVAASRVEMKKHYLSDVAFGAALGIVAGRTVTIGHEHKFALTPISSTDGAGVGAGLTWVGRK